MKLIIAEKPSVAKSIASALGASSRADGFYEGNGLLVSWCVGHLVSPMDAGGYDENFKKWRYDDLPILPEPFRYVLAPGKEDAFENLRALMNRSDVDTIVNACDAGREGELIFRLVYEMTDCRKPVLRLWISSMEDSAIREGFSDLRPGADYEALYQSALCRQKADWLVGINATRLFSVLYHRTLNVGRVQTPTLAMLAERDAKITLFHKEKYHLLRLTLNGAEAVSEKFTDPAEAEQAAVMCKGAAVTCTSVTKEQKKEQPPKLYDLTTLQREANRLFGYTAKQTLDYAQSLYEKKLLTYPRTDSRYLTSDMAETASCVIHLAAKLPPFDGCTNFFPLVEAMISDKDVSDHHAIIPTMEIEKTDIKALPLGERNLFLLVCCKLLCASAEPYVYEAVTAAFDCGGHSFTAKGKRVISEGWREIDRIFRAFLKEKPADGDGGTLPDFTEGQTFDGTEVAVTEHFTQPPKPYTEDTLLSAMENAGKDGIPDEAERKARCEITRTLPRVAGFSGWILTSPGRLRPKVLAVSIWFCLQPISDFFIVIFKAMTNTSLSQNLLGVFTAHSGDLMHVPDLEQAVEGRRDQVDRVAGAQRLCADVLDTRQLDDSADGAAGDHAGTGGCGLEYDHGSAEFTHVFMGDGRALARDAVEVLFRIVDPLADRIGNFGGFSEPDADDPVTVADDDQGCELEDSAALNRLGNTVQGYNPFLQVQGACIDPVSHCSSSF